ncbi:type II toxin-antitoxin system RelE/ParE family toxin [Serratia marcescens]|uniref:type II toxin-antitoxin system RelE/ParE family toxin n=1 Tax=Serratia marcescens TaxID=615 RepID=UPI00215657BB|nr:type II toxin-antitoxin system RelE/ParE family toxin [Serratia marcescens]
MIKSFRDRYLEPFYLEGKRSRLIPGGHRPATGIRYRAAHRAAVGQKARYIGRRAARA